MRIERTYTDKYIAADGRKFVSEQDCCAHELAIPEHEWFCLLNKYSAEALAKTVHWKVVQAHRGKELVDDGYSWIDTYSETFVAYLDVCTLSEAVAWLVTQNGYYRRYEYKISELVLFDAKNSPPRKI